MGTKVGEGRSAEKPVVKQIVLRIADRELVLTEGEARRLLGALEDLFGRPEVRYVDRWHERPWSWPYWYGQGPTISTGDQLAKQQAYSNQLLGVGPQPMAGAVTATAVEPGKLVPVKDWSKFLKSGKVDGGGPKVA